MSNLGGANIKDLLPWDDLPTHQGKLAFIHSELMRLNINIYLLEQILQFPMVFLYLDGIIYNTFFESYIENAFDMSVLIITRLSTNDKADPLTLETFRNGIEQRINPEYKAAFKELRKAIKCSWRTIEPIKIKLEDLRNEHIAHIDSKYVEAVFADKKTPVLQERLTFLSELKAVCDKLNAALHKLTFLGGAKFNLLPPWYQGNTSVGQSDIQGILNNIAKNSPILSMPEDDPDQWCYIMTSRREQLDQFNFYRRQFGLPERYLG